VPIDSLLQRGGHPASLAAGEPGRSTDRADARRIAQEFEAMLLLQMVRQMRQSLLEEPSSGEGLGAGTMTDTFDLEFARYLSVVGGLGLARALEGRVAAEATPALPQQQPAPSFVAAPTLPTMTTPPAAKTVGGAGLRADMPGVEATSTAMTLPLDATVSSRFGWRTDPFLGTTRFHGGIDLKAVYGRDVPTAGPGRVVFAGEQGAYGQTVVIDHGDGLRTRYAHLSAITVSSGQELAAGEVVGRVGRSGRATGPHLHFEVSRHGKKLDPAEIAQMSSRFKSDGRDDDFPVDSASGEDLSIGADHEG
jgi:murein DD-endopeptidase MepM/ murein hydrolase activator NlpD